MSLAWEEGEPTVSRKKPDGSWMKPFSRLDRGHQSSFDGSSVLLLFEHSLTDEAPDNTPLLPSPSGLLCCLLFLPAAPCPALPRSAGVEETKLRGSAWQGALSPSKGTNKRPAVPNLAGGILRKYRS